MNITQFSVLVVGWISFALFFHFGTDQRGWKAVFWAFMIVALIGLWGNKIVHRSAEEWAAFYVPSRH